MELNEELELIPERIESGCDFLTTHYPGWQERTNLNTLNVGSAQFCPLAQASADENEDGNYDKAKSKLGLTGWQAIELGFSIPDVEGVEARERYWNALDDAWHDYLLRHNF